MGTLKQIKYNRMVSELNKYLNSLESNEHT